MRFDRSWCLRCFAVRGPTSCCCRSSSICSFRRSFCSFRSRISLVDCRHSTQLRISTLQKNCFSSWRCVKGDAWWFSAHRLAEELSQEVRCVGGGVSVLVMQVFLSYLASRPAICADVWIRYRLWIIWMNTGAVTAAVADAWVSGTRCWTHFLWMSMCGSDVFME